jgi:hypothetical protein
MLGVGARLSFLRRALATRRWSFFKWLWVVIGAYDLVLSQILPKSLSDSFPTTYEALTTVFGPHFLAGLDDQRHSHLGAGIH